MIAAKFTTTFTVKRQGWTTEIVGDKTIDRSAEATAGTFLGYRQQSTPDYVQSLGLQMSKPHTVWCPVLANVVEGDVLESTYGVDRVRNVQINRDGNDAHKELVVEFIGEALPEGSESE